METASFPVLAEIDRLKTEIDALRPISPELERRIMDKFRLEWNYHSNAIEGNTISLGETKAFLLEGITAHGKPFRDYLDISGHNGAIDYVISFARQKAQLTEADIRNLHKILLEKPYHVDAITPEGKTVKRLVEIGVYKRFPNHVETKTGAIHHYATPEETPALMQDLMQWYRKTEEAGDTHPVTIATLFHHRFTAIHPFDDGNGRMARLLMNLILLRRGYVPLIVKKEDKGSYLLALAEADEGQPERFVAFLGAQLLASMELYLRGARGEDISGLGDIDKALALMNRRIETLADETPPAKTLELQVALFDKLIEPLFKNLHPRYEEVDQYFEKTQSSIKLAPGGTNEIPARSYRNTLRETMELQELGVIAVMDTWTGFHLNKMKQLANIIYLRTRSYEYSLSFKIRIDKEEGRNTILKRGRYDDVISSEEIAEFAKTILEQLLSSLETLIKERVE